MGVKAKKSYKKGGKIANELYEDPFSEIENRNKTTGSKVSSNSKGRKFSSSSAKNLTAGYGAATKRSGSTKSRVSPPSPPSRNKKAVAPSSGVKKSVAPSSSNQKSVATSSSNQKSVARRSLKKGGKIVAQGADRADVRADRKAARLEKRKDRKNLAKAVKKYKQ